MTNTQYLKNLQLMTNEELIREYESVQALANYTNPQSVWKSNLERVNTEMIFRGLKPIN